MSQLVELLVVKLPADREGGEDRRIPSVCVEGPETA